MGDLIIAGKSFKVDGARVVNWHESGWDATSERCIPTKDDSAEVLNGKCKPGTAPNSQIPYGKIPLPYTRRFGFRPKLRSYGLNPPLDATKAVIKQFVIHHDGCRDAEMCFNVVQNERGLSVHFLLDNDGTIYQTLDLALMAYHASEWNIGSIGVELCSRGDVKLDEHYYSKQGINRPRKLCKINGTTIDSWDYMGAQYEALTALARALTKYLPNLAIEYPQSSAGVQSWETMPMNASMSFSGYIGHYHLTNQKWDPGPFDFKEFCRKLRGAFCMPMFAKDDPKRAPEEKPLVPSQTDDLKATAADLFKANEQKADGGFFPVGPWGEHRLWHGGVHLTGKENQAIYAPFPGRVLAARIGATSPVGSVNFVLVRHDMSLGKSAVQFFSLYMHLADEAIGATAPGWLIEAKKKADIDKKPIKPGEVLLLDEPVEASAQLGRMGKAGPAELARPQIHLEFFSTSPLFTDYPNSPWVVVDGSGSGRFCDADQINGLIDTNKDGLLSRQELSQFFSGGGADALHLMVTNHVSEWTAEPSWADALRVPKDFKKVKPAEIDQLVAEQITPALWWDDAVAAHCRLPPDGVVYHYHPVAFLRWFNQMVLDAAAVEAAAGGRKLDAKDAKAATAAGLMDDKADESGASMRSNLNETGDPCNDKITLKEMVMGFDAPECTP
jgi:N-acetyl-anhydromuramyl-L-alanine amidase AmpD